MNVAVYILDCTVLTPHMSSKAHHTTCNERSRAHAWLLLPCFSGFSKKEAGILELCRQPQDIIDDFKRVHNCQVLAKLRLLNNINKQTTKTAKHKLRRLRSVYCTANSSVKCFTLTPFSGKHICMV